MWDLSGLMDQKLVPSIFLQMLFGTPLCIDPAMGGFFQSWTRHGAAQKSFGRSLDHKDGPRSI